MCNFFPVEKIKYLCLTIFLSGLTIPGSSNIVQTNDSIINKSGVFKAEELIRGERLFYGLVNPENKSIKCAGCHNTRFSDTLNWNPGALEISEKFLGKSAGDLSKVLLNPAGIKMAQVHKGFQFSPE